MKENGYIQRNLWTITNSQSYLRMMTFNVGGLVLYTPVVVKSTEGQKGSEYTQVLPIRFLCLEIIAYSSSFVITCSFCTPSNEIWIY